MENPDNPEPVSLDGGGDDENSETDETSDDDCSSLTEEQQSVMYNVDVLDGVFPFLNTREWLTCRRVCSIWNDLAIKLLGKEGRLGINIEYFPDKAQHNHTRFHAFLSKLSEDQRKNSLIPHALIRIRIEQSLSLLEQGRMLGILKDFGSMIRRLDIRNVVSVQYIAEIFRHCRNLKELTFVLVIQIRIEQMTQERQPNVYYKALYDGTYSEAEDEEPAVLKHLQSLTMVCNVPWAFGDFLATRAPNLTTIRFTERTYRASLGDVLVVNNYDDEEHFTNELSKMNTSQIKNLGYEFIDPSFRTCVKLDKLLELDFSSLEICSLVFTKDRKVIMEDFHRFLQKISPTLKCLTIASSLFKAYEGIVYPKGRLVSFPWMLPHLTKCILPYQFIWKPDFFAKMPALKHLALDDSSHFRYTHDKTYGFRKENMAMWEVGTGWLPHPKLTNLKIEQHRQIRIPETLTSMFPKLTSVSVEMKEVGTQLTRIMDILKDHLITFKIRDATTDASDVPFSHPRLSLYIAFALTGVDIRALVCDQPFVTRSVPESIPVDVLRTFSTLTSLRDMTNLKRFDLEVALPQVIERVTMLLEDMCFSSMPNLKSTISRRCDVDHYHSESDFY